MPDNQNPEIALMLQYKESGDIAVLGKLYQPYMSMVYGVCLKYLKDRDDSKDAVMQLFEKLPAALRAHEVANFKSWLYVMARNHCLMQLRSKKGKFSEELGPDLMENDFLLHQQDDTELENDLSRLENCIGELEDEQQKCVRLFFLEEKSYKDISAITGFDLNKVKSYIQNGKRNLKICMERNE